MVRQERCCKQQQSRQDAHDKVYESYNFDVKELECRLLFHLSLLSGQILEFITKRRKGKSFFTIVINWYERQESNKFICSYKILTDWLSLLLRHLTLYYTVQVPVLSGLKHPLVLATIRVLKLSIES